MRRISFSPLFLSSFIFVHPGLFGAIDGHAAAGDCGQPISAGATSTATDALAALRAAVGLQECELCVCDIDNSGAVAATDALAILKVAVGQAISLLCPACVAPLVALPGRDQDVLLGDKVILVAAASGLEESATFEWSLFEAPEGASFVLADPAAIEQAIIADVAGAYTLELVATEGERTSEPARVTIRAAAELPEPPVVIGVDSVAFSAVRDLLVEPSSNITLGLSGPVDVESITSDTIKLMSGNSSLEIMLEIDATAETVTLIPVAPLPLDDAFRVTVEDLTATTEPFEFERFSATFLTPAQESADVEGFVLTPARAPLAGVTIRIGGEQTATDNEGFFRIAGLPPGAQHLQVDPSTVNDREAYTPLAFDMELVAGPQANKLGAPIVLTIIDTGSTIDYPTERVLVSPSLPELVIDFTGSNVTREDGTPYFGPLSVTPVSAPDVPMPFPRASQTFWTVQPGGLLVDPPAKITVALPISMDPGEEVDLWAFNHGTNDWEDYGTGMVNEDSVTATGSGDQGMPFTGWAAVITRREVTRPIGFQPQEPARSSGSSPRGPAPQPVEGIVVDGALNPLHGVLVEGGGDKAYTDYDEFFNFDQPVDGKYTLRNVLVGFNNFVNGSFTGFQPVVVRVCATAFDLSNHRYHACVTADPTSNEFYDPSQPDGNIIGLIKPERIVLEDYLFLDEDNKIHLHRDSVVDFFSHRLGPLSPGVAAISNGPIRATQRYRDEVRVVAAKLASLGFREENSGKPFLEDTEEFNEDKPLRAKKRCPITDRYDGAIHRAVKLFQNIRLTKANGLVFWDHDGIVDEQVLRALNETDGVLWAPANAPSIQAIHGYLHQRNLTKFIHPTITKRLVSIREITGRVGRLNSLTLPMGGDRALRCPRRKGGSNAAGHDRFHGVGSAIDFGWIQKNGRPGGQNFFRALRPRLCLGGVAGELLLDCVMSKPIRFLAGKRPDPAEEWRPDVDSFADEREALTIGGRTWTIKDNYSRELTREYVEAIKAQPNRRKVLFNDPRIVAGRAKGHSNHIHAEFFYSADDRHPDFADGAPGLPSLIAAQDAGFTLVAVEPDPSEGVIATDTEEITLTFSQTVDPATVNGQSVLLVCQDTAEEVPVNVRLSADGLEITVVPTVELRENSSFVLAMSEQIKSTTGDNVILPDGSLVVHEFSTGLPSSVLSVRFGADPIVLTRDDLSAATFELIAELDDGSERVVVEAADDFLLLDEAGRDLDPMFSQDEQDGQEQRLRRTFLGRSLLTAFAENGDEPAAVVEADLFDAPAAVSPVALVGDPLLVEFDESLAGDELSLIEGMVVDRDGQIHGGSVFTAGEDNTTAVFTPDRPLPRFQPLNLRIVVQVTDPAANTIDVVTQVEFALIGTAPGDIDTDGDGIPDIVESESLAGCADPDKADTDGDGIPDGEEDCDGDTLTNARELEEGLDLASPDTDGDGTFDPIELNFGCDPRRPEVTVAVGRVINEAQQTVTDALLRASGRATLSDDLGEFVLVSIPACPARTFRVLASSAADDRELEGVSDSFTTVDGGLVDVGDITIVERAAPRYAGIRPTGPGLGRDAAIPVGLAIADMNGDFILDAVVLNRDDVAIMLGDGAGELTLAGTTQPDAVVNLLAVAVGDFDGDGLPDVVVGGQGSVDAVAVLRNVGDGALVELEASTVTARVSALAVGDVDGDLDDDVIVANRGISLLRGNGDGSFAAEERLALPNRFPEKVRLVDLDADGALDIITLNDGYDEIGQLSVALGNGDGTFGNEQGFMSTPSGDGYDLAVGDLDGDLVPDLVTVDQTGSSSTISVLLGDGNGAFADPIFSPTGSRGAAIALGDVNGDSDLDVVVANELTEGEAFVSLGNGDGTLGAAVPYPLAVEPVGLALFDTNADAVLDVVAVHDETRDLTIHRGIGDGSFAPNRVPYIFRGNLGRPLELVDVDGDGARDFVSSTSLALGNGDLTFGELTDVGLPPLAFGIAIGDLDGDMEIDIVVRQQERLLVAFGIGDGGFENLQELDARADAFPDGVTLADMNGDGITDLLYGDAAFSDVSIQLGLGDRTFEPPVRVATNFRVSLTSVADFNRDGDVDLLIAGSGVSFLAGDGDGGLGAPVAVDTRTGSDLAIADFNGDGAPDFTIAGDSDVFLYIGNGDGTFQNGVPYAAGERLRDVVVLDIDGNDAPDLLAAGESTMSLLINTGDATFEPAEQFVLFAPGRAPAIAAGDLNGDGLPDVVATPGSFRARTVLLPHR